MELQPHQAKTVTDHAFEPSTCYPDGEGCAHIVQGAQWTMMDPIRCRKPEREHAMPRASNAELKGGGDEQ